MSVLKYLKKQVCEAVIENTLEKATIRLEQQQKEKETRQASLQKLRDEFDRKADIEDKRKNTPCKFRDGISYDEFCEIVHCISGRMKRIKKIDIMGPVVQCVVDSQTGYSEWGFQVDFNDWGHLTGTYWLQTENSDSNIASYFGKNISGGIHDILESRGISLREYSDYVDADNVIGSPEGLCSANKKQGVFARLAPKRSVATLFDSEELVGEHAYLVVSMLRSSGFCNIKTIPICDIGRQSEKYPYEVEQVVIGGTSYFTEDDCFLENTEIIITYHAKQLISIHKSPNSFKKKQYQDIIEQLFDMGFSNIYEREQNDLLTGWITKDGTVEQVLVQVGADETPIKQAQAYEYDTKIIVVYHTRSH